MKLHGVANRAQNVSGDELKEKKSQRGEVTEPERYCISNFVNQDSHLNPNDLDPDLAARAFGTKVKKIM